MSMYICTFLVSSASCGPVCVPSLIRVCRGIEREEGFSSRAQFVSHYVIGFAVVWRVAAAWFRGREGGGTLIINGPSRRDNEEGSERGRLVSARFEGSKWPEWNEN